MKIILFSEFLHIEQIPKSEFIQLGGNAMFFEILESLCSQNKTTVTQLLKTLGLSTSKGTAWRNGSIPSGDTLAKIADCLDVSVDYLLGRTDTKKLPAESGKGDRTAMENEFFALWELLTPDQRKTMITVMKSLLLDKE